MGVSSDSRSLRVNISLTLAGAVVGGAVGFLVFGWLVRQGFYAPAIPGVLVGVGGGMLARERSLVVAVVCGFLGAALCLFAEWQYFPFVRDGSLSYFLSHFIELKPLTMIMVALGGFAGFWFVWRAKPAGPSCSIPVSKP